MNLGVDKGVSAAIDVQGFNYAHWAMDNFHARYPRMPMIPYAPGVVEAHGYKAARFSCANAVRPQAGPPARA